MNKKNLSGLTGVFCAVTQAIFYFLGNIDMVYILTIPLCVSTIFNFEEQWKEKYHITAKKTSDSKISEEK